MERVQGVQSERRGRRGRDLSGAPPGAESWHVERVARYLDVSNKRVYQLVQEKRLESIKLGPRQMRVVKSSLESYIAALTRAAAEGMDDMDGME